MAQHDQTYAGLVNAWTDIQRMRGKNDHNCIKCWSLMEYFMCYAWPAIEWLVEILDC